MNLISYSEMKRKDRFAGVILKWRLFDVLPDGVNQRKLADLLDCSEGTISLVKSGKRNPDVRWIEIISEKLNIPKWQLFADPKDVIPKEYLDLMESYRALPPDRKPIVDDMLYAARSKNKSSESELKKTRTSNE